MNISKYTDKSLVKKVQLYGDSDAASELINRHKNLVFHTIQKFYSRNPNLNLQDLLDDTYSIFHQSIKTYKPYKKTKFSSWLSLQTRFWILNNNKNADKSYSLENKDIELLNNSQNNHYHDNTYQFENRDLILKYISKINDDRIKQIFKMRYIDVDGNKLRSWKSIGAELNLSIPGVINLHDKGKKIIIENIKNSEKYI